MPHKDINERRAYHKKYYKEYYQKRKQYHYDRNKKRSIMIKDYVQQIKNNSSCVKCGESHPACLDFHHRDPKHKDFVVALLYKTGRSIKKIDAEIAKCDILCANCHRKLHWEERC